MIKLVCIALLTCIPLTVGLYGSDAGDKPLVIILMGPPASGKGTQAVRLSKELEILHVSTGELFRENILNGTELGKKVKSYVDSGKLTPDDLVIDMLFDRISRPDAQKGYLLDGFPRTVSQAEALGKRLKDVNLVILNLNVPDDVILKRIEGRLTCKACKNVQNKYFSPPTKEGICDKCGGQLYQRTDDSMEVAKERLKEYYKQTEPVLDYYKANDKVIDIDGNRDPDIVFKELLQALPSRKGNKA